MTHTQALDLSRPEVATPADLPEPRSLSGWALPALIRLDEHRPGFLAVMHQTRSRRRQVVYAALAQDAEGAPRRYAELLGDGHGWHGAIWPGLLAEALLTADHRDLLRVAYGSVPDGLLSLLTRCGPDPLPVGLYARLHALCGDPKQRRRRELLAAMPVLTPAKIEIVDRLPECVLHPNVLRLARSVDQAEQIAAAVNLALTYSPATPGSIWKSVSDLQPETRLPSWMAALLGSFDRSAAQPDISGLEGATLLDTGAKLRSAGRGYQNCLGRDEHVLDVMTGRCAFVALQEPPCVVILRPAGREWCVTGVYGRGNNRLLPEHEKVVREGLRTAGFPRLGGEPCEAVVKVEGLAAGFWLAEVED